MYVCYYFGSNHERTRTGVTFVTLWPPNDRTYQSVWIIPGTVDVNDE